MAGAVFIICVPTEEYEKELTQKNKKKIQEQTLRKCKSNSNTSAVINQYTNESSFSNNTEKEPLCSKATNSYASTANSEDRQKDDCLYMQKVMENILKELKIENAIWSKSLDNHYIQVILTIQVDSLYEEVLEILKEHSIGSKFNSVTSVIPCTLHYKANSEDENDHFANNYNDDEKLSSKNTGWSKFLLSVRARLNVAQVVENIKHHAALKFDFICLLIIASIICAIGLMENNNVYLISSMLISPMMGPVMASTFGKVIPDRKLQKMGLLSELIGLGTSTIIGFIYGIIICICTDKCGQVEWPTMEMISRGEVRSIGVGYLIALLSGAALALAVLRDKTSSLVGVAISTSLMPPAVNAGLLWSLASVYYIKGNETTTTFIRYYFDLTSLAAVSLCLTFVNIICIYLAGILVFKVKEVAPVASRALIRQFWNYDIKIARNYNKTLNSNDTKNIQDDLKNEFADYRKSFLRNKLQSFMEDFHHSADLTNNADKIKIKSQYTWSPCMLSLTEPTTQHIRTLYNIIKESGAFQTLNSIAPVFNLGTALPGLFSPLKNDTSAIKISQENLASASETTCQKKVKRSKNKRSLEKTKKFIVTPCQPTQNEYEYP